MHTSVVRGRPPTCAAFQTRYGRMVHGKAEEVLKQRWASKLKGRVQLVFTSPPFPLNRKKRYGNKQGDEYLDWFASFGEMLTDYLTEDGSIVVEMGNAWEPGEPVMSTLAIEALLAFKQAGALKLCQEFIWNNPAKLPSPAQWVNIERIRVKDSFTRLWWMSPSSKPKACNRRVLTDYSPAMKRLLKSGRYNAGRRPSEHEISEESFLTNNGGAIPGSVLTYANTRAMDSYQQYCREQGLERHPARMPIELPRFFIDFLTDRGDLILDPFGGSNTTGQAAEEAGRQWIAVEPNLDYIAGARGRFSDDVTSFFE